MAEWERGSMDSAARAFAACARVAEDCIGATASGPFADGYRAAAGRMRQEIARLAAGEPRTPLERDLHDIETEARTLASVVRASERVVSRLDVDGEGVEAVRTILAEFFEPDDLPAVLRPTVDMGSTTRLVQAPTADEKKRGRL